MRLVWQFLAVAVVALGGSRAVAAVQGNPWLTLVLGALTCVVAVYAYRWVVRRTEQRTIAELAGQGAVPGLFRGVLVGFAMFGAVIGTIALNGDYHVHGRDSVTGALELIGFMGAAAVTEELLIRGVLYRIVEGRFGTWIALGATAVIFGAMHLTNKNATVWGAVAIAIEAGGMLAAAYAATRSLWVGIGLHFAWNFAESGIFSTQVSGNGDTHGLLASTTSGPTLVTGGEFGPEASIYSVLYGAIVMLAFLWLARRRGNIVPLRRRTVRSAEPATVPQ